MNRFPSPLLLLVTLAFFCAPALAQQSDAGINTSGETALPLGAGGKQAMWIRTATQSGAPTGNVGIGVETPTANLHVARGIKVGTADNAVAGNACAGKEGTLSQGTGVADGNLLLCAKDTSTSVVKWKSLGKSGSVYGLQSKTNVRYGAWTTSNILQYNAADSTTVTVTPPGFLRINGGGWVQSSPISQGQTVQLGMTAPFANLATYTVTLTTGGEQDTWSVTTAPSTTINAYINWGGWVISCQVGSSCSNSEHHGSFDNEYNCNGSGQNVYIQTYAGSNAYAYQFRNDCNEWYGSYSGDTNATSWSNGWNISVWVSP